MFELQQNREPKCAAERLGSNERGQGEEENAKQESIVLEMDVCREKKKGTGKREREAEVKKTSEWSGAVRSQIAAVVALLMGTCERERERN